MRFSEWADRSTLLFQDGRWCLPRGGMPTTHIFKLPVAASRPLQFDGMKALVVERFDRA